MVSGDDGKAAGQCFLERVGDAFRVPVRADAGWEAEEMRSRHLDRNRVGFQQAEKLDAVTHSRLIEDGLYLGAHRAVANDAQLDVGVVAAELGEGASQIVRA